MIIIMNLWIGYTAATKLKIDGFWLSTAHAAKFGEVTEMATGKVATLPEKLKNILSEKRIFKEITVSDDELKKYLLEV